MGVNTIEHNYRKQLAQFIENPLPQLYLTPWTGSTLQTTINDLAFHIWITLLLTLIHAFTQLPSSHMWRSLHLHIFTFVLDYLIFLIAKDGSLSYFGEYKNHVVCLLKLHSQSSPIEMHFSGEAYTFVVLERIQDSLRST